MGHDQSQGAEKRQGKGDHRGHNGQRPTIWRWPLLEGRQKFKVLLWEAGQGITLGHSDLGWSMSQDSELWFLYCEGCEIFEDILTSSEQNKVGITTFSDGVKYAGNLIKATLYQ